jgi:hypothetical protein
MASVFGTSPKNERSEVWASKDLIMAEPMDVDLDPPRGTKRKADDALPIVTAPRRIKAGYHRIPSQRFRILIPP